MEALGMTEDNHKMEVRFKKIHVKRIIIFKSRKAEKSEKSTQISNRWIYSEWNKLTKGTCTEMKYNNSTHSFSQ